MKLSQHGNDLAGWESLPSELIQLVSEWLHFDTLVRLNEVCSLWKAALDDETLWRHRFILAFGPLSSCHLNLPRPPHLHGGATLTSTRVLKWKKRFHVMRNLSLSDVKLWPLLHGCPWLSIERVGVNRKFGLALTALLFNDIKSLELAVQNCLFARHQVSI